jgi:hypothetical protein
LEWIENVSQLTVTGPAVELYAGRGFGLARQAADDAKARLYIVSAGLGIVPFDRNVPAYGLTVSAGHNQSISRKIVGEFDPRAWFESLLNGSLSVSWQQLAGRKSGRVLVALSRPYAKMVGDSLSTLPPGVRGRLRIFGASLQSALPKSLHPNIAPYDERLNVILPGTRSEFAQRALLHFVRSIATKPSSGLDDDFAAVRSALKRLKMPQHVHRPRLTDKEILVIIRKRLRIRTGVVQMLTALRHEEGIACERSRFSRLYRMAAGPGKTS